MNSSSKFSLGGRMGRAKGHREGVSAHGLVLGASVAMWATEAEEEAAGPGGRGALPLSGGIVPGVSSSDSELSLPA